jgi:hypothetical protein
MSQFENFVEMVEGWTVEERGRVFALLSGGGKVVAVSTPVKTVAKKVVAPKAPVKAAKPLPEGVPTAADYRLTEADIDVSVCLGRVFDAEPDKRFRPAVYQEGQCGGAQVEGCDLCVTCQRRMTKYAEAGVEKPGPWLGRVTEDPMPWCNMLDSAKLLAKPPKWVADGGSDAGSAAASEGGAESEGAEQMPLSSSSSSAVGGAGAPSKPVKLSAAEKAAALADKAKVAAEKAAAALAKKEAAEAKKAAAEAKKAEKAAAPKPAPKAAAAKKAAAPAASVVVSAAASTAEPKEAEGEFDMLDGELRFVRNGNVYEFDAMTEKVGCFLGRKTADGTIDADAEEVGAAEAE